MNTFYSWWFINFGTLYNIINMKTKHKHRRSSSIEIKPEKENMVSENNEEVQESSSNLIRLTMASVEIM